jgi:hypothetical protein
MEFQRVIDAAGTDDAVLTALRNDPYALLFPGQERAAFRKADFNLYFAEEIEPLIFSLSPSIALKSFPSVSCAACKTGAYSIAALIVAAAAAGLSTLTATSSVVVQLATFAGVGTNTALVFIVTLGAAAANGVSDVVNAICDWMGACP